MGHYMEGVGMFRMKETQEANAKALDTLRSPFFLSPSEITFKVREMLVSLMKFPTAPVRKH